MTPLADRLIKWLPAAALTIGPCAAWLVWAIVNRRWGHVVCAGTANLLLWSVGPLFIAFCLRLKGVN